MLNDRATTIDLLLSRRSGKPRDMIAPGPDADELAVMLRAAARVPDHGKIAPWRFIVVPPAARGDFAAMLEQALATERPDVDARDLEDARLFALQAPALVAVLSVPDRAHKIPVWEQELSAGIAAYNMELAAHAFGYVAGWLTGWAAYSPAVYAALGGEPGGRVAGFLFFGTPARPIEERPRPSIEAVTRVWHA